jgi:cytidylate kinase
LLLILESVKDHAKTQKNAKAQRKQRRKVMIIAIDGPSASGKSTLGRMLAHELNLLYVDTGSMYRAVALATLQAGIASTDTEAVGALANKIHIDLQGGADNLRVILNGKDVTEEVRSDKVTETSSVVSAIPAVRRAMVALQREMGRRGAVLNGRDIGTVVFPNADVKFFLTASANERAGRRFKEEQVLHHDVSFDETLADLSARDERDSTRIDSPLKIAEDAIVIDSSGLSIEQVLDKMLAIVNARKQASNTLRL